MTKPKGLLLYGGGLDSTALLIHLALAKYDLTALHINYGQVAFEEEQLACERFCKKYNVPYHTLLLDLQEASPYASIVGGNGGDCMDGRNAVLIMTAAMYAAARNIYEVYIGFHEEPPHAPFPDATKAGLKAMQQAVDIMFKAPIELCAPFITESRVAIARKAVLLDPAFFIDSHTCYANVPGGCGVCAHCVQKAEFERQVRA